MLNNGLKLNYDKSEFLTIGTSQQLEKSDNISNCVGDSDIHSVPIARNLGSWFDRPCHGFRRHLDGWKKRSEIAVFV